MDELNNFFLYLGIRLYKENNLSDITWALLQASDEFKQLFIKFFFPEIEDNHIKYINDIEREKRDNSEKGSRVDFWIRTDSAQYIIEVKISDKNQHFEKYIDDYNIPPSHFGYITNYIIDKDGDYQIRRWENLYDYLYEHTHGENELIEGYCEYVKRVCGFIKFSQPMKINNAYNSLFEFIKTVEKQVNRTEDNRFELTNCRIKLRGGGRSHNLGVNFDILIGNKESSQKVAEPWLGIYYDREYIDIWFAIEQQDSLYNCLKRNYSNGNGSFEIYGDEDGAFWFKLNKKEREKLETCSELKEQEEILKKFIDDVVEYLLKAKMDC